MVSNAHSTPLSALEAVVLDTETTGLDAKVARIVQIGAVRIHGTSIDESDRFETLVNPGQPIPPATTAVHGISDADVADAPGFGDIEERLRGYLGQSILVGHTLSFDLAMLEREHQLAAKPWRAPRLLDVRWLARVASPTLAHYDLDGLCAWLNIEVNGRHTAIGDALATARVFAALVPKLRQRGIRTLAEAEAASRRLAEQDARNAGGLIAVETATTNQTQPLVKIDSFPYRHRVSDVMSAPPVIAPSETTVAEAIALLASRGISSVFVKAANGECGIVTERDILKALNGRGSEALATRLDAIATTPLQTVPDDAFVYRAIGRLNRLGLRHLGVRNARGDIVGALTPRNLLRQRATSAIVLGDEIDSATSVAQLGRAWAKLPLMTHSLLEEEVDARAVSSVISAEICALTRRAAEMAEARMRDEGKGAPPAPYCVLVLGSAGRGESLLAADQDNAIVFEKGEAGGPEDLWFEAMATHMSAILDEVGIPFCKGGVMARNALWRHSLEGWFAQIDGWVRRQRPEDLLNVDIFYDGVPVHGDLALGEAIWAHAYLTGRTARDFLMLLAMHAGEGRAPLTLFGGIKTEENGRVDLKKHGLMPIFTSARVLSIRHDVRQRSTPARLRGVNALGIGAAEDIEALVAAHETILGAMLSQQMSDIEQGVLLSSRVEPGRLAKKSREALAEALKKVSIATELVNEGRI